MNILLVNPTYDCAGGKILLSKGINKYTKHNCRHVVGGTLYPKYQTDVVLNINDGLLDGLIERADAVAFFLWDYDKQFGNIKWRERLEGKKVLFNPQSFNLQKHKKNHFNGTNVQAFHFHEDEKFLYGSKWMPIYIPINDKEYMPIKKRINKMIIIGQSPSQENRKDTDDLRGVTDELRKRRYPVNLSVLTNIENYLCLKRKQAWHIAFDNFQDGHEGKSGWESLSMGTPTFTRLKSAQKKALKKWGKGYQPLHCVKNKKELLDKLGILIKNRSILKILSESSRQWMEEYMQPERVLGKFIEIIEGTKAWKKPN